MTKNPPALSIISIFAVLVLIVVCLRPALAQPPTPQPLVLGKPIERELKGDETHSYTITLQAGQFLNLVVEQKGIDVVVTLFDPTGKKIAEVDSPNGTQGPEPVVFVVEIPGNYRLEVRSLEKTAAAGRYEVKVKELRTVTEKDKNQIAAQKAFAEGEALRLQGVAESLRGAIKKYEEALPLFRAAEDRQGESLTLNNIGVVNVLLGERRQALKFFNDSLPLARELGDKQGEAVTLNNIGLLYAGLGDNQQALKFYNESLPIRRAVGDKQGEAVTLNNMGNAYADLGENELALKFLNESLPIRRAVDDKIGEASTLSNMGILYYNLGEKELALKFLNESLPIRRAVGDKRGEANTLSNIGETYRSLGEVELALKFFNESLLLGRLVGNKGGEAATLRNIGLVYKNLGEKQQALKYYNESLPLSRAVGDKRGEAATLNNIGTLYLFGETQKALEYFDQALLIDRAVGNKNGEAGTLTNIGTAYGLLGEKQKALDFLHESLSRCRVVDDKNLEPSALANLATLWQKLRSPRFSVFYGKKAVNDLESLRSKILGLNKNSQQTFLQSIESTYRALADELLAQQRFAEAQQILNLFKDQQYFDFKSNTKAVPLALTAHESALATELDERLDAVVTATRLVDEMKRMVGAKTPTAEQTEQLKLLDDKLKAANIEYQVFLKRAESEFAAPPDEKDKIPDVSDVHEMQVALQKISAANGQNTVAVYALVGKDDYRVLIVTQAFTDSVSFSIKGKELNEKAIRLWRLLRTPKYDPRLLSKEIYDIVFAPIKAKLPKGTKTILWSLDGNLRYIPMAALCDGKKYLAEQDNNVVFTRADKERLTRARSTNVAGTGMGSSEEHTVELAGAKFSATSLPAVKTELKGIFRNAVSPGVLSGEVLLDQQFTKSAMIGSLQNRRPLVHIASHFKFEPGDEARSFLLLGDGTPFTLDQMKNEKDLFKGVDLLTLSACQTAAQRADANGREVDGFAELAQRLGAGAVMASLWEVSDNSTAQLMSRFYQGYVKDGLNKADAIRQAQLALLKGDYKPDAPATRQLTQADKDAESIKIDPAKLQLYKPKKNAPYSHPYYWSPFILIGNWK